MSGAAWAASGAAKSLSEVVRLTISTHPEIQRDKALRRAAEKFIDEQFAGYLPRIDFDAASGFEYTNSPATRGRNGPHRNQPSGRGLWRSDASVTLEQMLFDGFETNSRVRSARADRDAAIERVIETSERIGIQVVEAYLEVLRNQELLPLAEENVAAHEDTLERVRQQVEDGLAASVDLDQGKARLALARSTLSRTMGDLRAANVRYIEIVGEPPEGLTRPMPPEFDQLIDLDDAISRAMDDNPTLRVTAARMRARAADIGVARAPYFPRFDFEVKGSHIENLNGVLGPNTDFNVLLRMRQNLFRGYFDRASKRQATFEAAAAAENDSEARRRIREELRVTYRILQAAHLRLQPLQDHVAAALRTLEAYIGQFELGRRSLFDLLNSQNELFRSRVDLVNNEFDVLVARYRLLLTMGRLLPSLAIEAPLE
ncbi:MAG: TolC family outer membrane protein [Kiloniellales bacterium]